MTTPYIGQITLFGGNFAIAGWAFCNGNLMGIAQNTTLYTLIGTTYGGDGNTTFALPNLQSRVAIHQGNGAGLSPYVIGQVGGTENVTLTTAQIPSHMHTLTVTSTVAVSGGQTPGPTLVPGTTSVAAGALFAYDNGVAPPPTSLKLGSAACSTSGSSQQHSNLMPTLCVNYLIALVGIYPSRS
jgi:microcystin-dependent protein